MRLSWFQRMGIALSLGGLFYGCYPVAKIPIDAIHYDAKGAKTSRILIIFLPGSGDSITVFQKKDIIDAVRERGLPIDMIAVNAHVGYYMNWSLLTRLKEDVIDPARGSGYNHIWLVGDSMGAYGAISYAKQYPDDITGVVLLGPFLGNEELIAEIKQAGGLQAWRPGAVRENPREEWERGIWTWLGDSRLANRRYQGMYLGYGHNDRFSYAQDYLASLLPPEQVISIDGGHNWSTWEKIWGMLLDRNIFQVDKL